MKKEEDDDDDLETVVKKRKLIDYQNTIPTLEIIQDARNDQHESVFIDEIKLTALKKSLIDNDIQVNENFCLRDQTLTYNPNFPCVTTGTS